MLSDIRLTVGCLGNCHNKRPRSSIATVELFRRALQAVRIFFILFLPNCTTMANLERQLIRGEEYTRVVRLDGRGDLLLNNGRVFRLSNPRTRALVCAYDLLDLRPDGSKVEQAPLCEAGPTDICGHVVAPHALAYAEFWRALRLALCYLRVHCYPSLMKSEVQAVFRALKVEFFGIYEFSFSVFWERRENGIKFLRTSDLPWTYAAALEVELALYQEQRPEFRPFLDNYRGQVPPRGVEPEEPETEELRAFKAAARALAESMGQRAVKVVLTTAPGGRGRGRTVQNEYRF